MKFDGSLTMGDGAGTLYFNKAKKKKEKQEELDIWCIVPKAVYKPTFPE